MDIVLLVGCIALLILQIAGLKINPFIAFILTAFFAGVSLGLPITQLSSTLQKGFGDMLGGVSFMLIFGACIGKITVSSGAAQIIATRIMELTGKKYARLGLMITGFVVGLPLFYGVGFMLLIPVLFSVAYQFKLSRVYLGIPMLASLSVAHGFLPPHPSPMALTTIMNAQLGLVLLYGILIAIPTICLAGLLFSSFLKKIEPESDNEILMVKEVWNNKKLPSFSQSIWTVLFPVLALTLTAVVPFFSTNTTLLFVSKTFGDPSILMFIALLVCYYSFGIRLQRSLKSIMEETTIAIKDVASLLLIMGGAGCLKEVMLVSGVNQSIWNLLGSTAFHPYFLAWLMAALLRICVGSATIAGLMTAGILGSMVTNDAIDPNLVVLSIGAGSLMCSHVNDPSFWLFKEYFNLSLKNTFKSWTVMESLVSILGIVFVFVLNAILH